MLTLPAIVSQIREQKPGVVPLSLWLDEAGWCDTGCSNTYRMTEETVIAVLEAALWRVYCDDRQEDRVYAGVRIDGGGWPSAFHGDRLDIAVFDPADPLALIRALCHAIGVRLEDA